MNKLKNFKAYSLILRLRKALFVLGLLASLTACQNALRTPRLEAGDIFQLGSWPEGASAGPPIYARHFPCLDAEEIAVNYTAVTAGKVTRLWEGQHKRVAGAQGNGCLLAMFEGSQDKPEALQIDFSFPDDKTAVSGEGKLITLAELNASEDRAFTDQDLASLTWNISAGTAIAMTEPTLVYWQVIFPKDAPVNDLLFNSASEIIEVSRARPELTFQVVTLQLLS
ncbi:MAG: hypothetical protein AAF821_05165 [Cyanobacteria bacterium P01_D01_bin.156]